MPAAQEPRRPRSGDLEVALTAWRLDPGWDADTLCRQAERVEALGFHSFWLPENHFGKRGAIPSPLTLLAAVAGRTRRLRLGTTSYLLPVRHPIQAAEEVAVLDQLSAGRLILGVGRGVQDSVFRVFGVEPGSKRDRFRQCLATMQAAWRGEPLEIDGQGQPVLLSPLPVQQPSPPIWVAAFGKLALGQVGGLGLPYLASPIEPLAVLEANYRLYREARSEAGFGLEDTRPLMRTVFACDDAATVNRVKDALAKSAPKPRTPTVPNVDDWAIVGEPAYVADRLAHYVEHLEVTHLIGGGRLPPVGEALQLRSHEYFARIAQGLGGPGNTG